MAVKIRLRRVGAKKAPFYRVVVADSRFPRDGRFIEEIGTYDPNKEPSEIKIDAEKAKQWIHFYAETGRRYRRCKKCDSGGSQRCRTECLSANGGGCWYRWNF